jgi:glycosyltransferase involved in cell wall biosynthesis
MERDHLSDLVPGYHRIEVIANGVSLDDYELDGLIPRPNTLIYTGSFRYCANYEAMLWFVNDVLPIIKREVPDVQLTITGDHANLPFPASENVILTGYVDDVRPLIASSWVTIAPLLVGGGTRLKVLEAMALRSPVVATSKGVEGLSVQDGEHLLIANRSEDFAQSILLLLRDAELRQRLASNAYQLVQQHYDWKVIMPEFLKLIDKAGSK